MWGGGGGGLKSGSGCGGERVRWGGGVPTVGGESGSGGGRPGRVWGGNPAVGGARGCRMRRTWCGGGSRGSRRSRTGGAQSDEMKGGEMKSLKKDEEEERAEHT